MPVQFTSKSASGNIVTVNVNNPYSVAKTVTVSLHVLVNGVDTPLTSERTEIPPGTTAPVVLDAGGPATFTADQPEPTVMVWED